MINEWALYSSVCSLLPLTHLLCSSCLGVLISLQRAEINSSRRAGQGRKEICWRFRGISHGLQEGMGLDLSERLRLRALWEDLLFPSSDLSFSLSATFFLFLMVLQSWIQNSQERNQLAGFSRLSCPNYVPVDYSCKGEDSRVQRQGIFCPDYLGVE